VETPGDPADDADACIGVVAAAVQGVVDRLVTTDQAAQLLIDESGLEGAPYRVFVRNVVDAQAAAQRSGRDAGLPAAMSGIERDCRAFVAE
jgi:hypothetical protein